MCANCSLKLRCYKDVIYYTFYSTNKLKEVHLRAYFELLMVKKNAVVQNRQCPKFEQFSIIEDLNLS